MKICRKRDPGLENFRATNPPIRAAHTRTLNVTPRAFVPDLQVGANL